MLPATRATVPKSVRSRSRQRLGGAAAVIVAGERELADDHEEATPPERPVLQIEREIDEERTAAHVCERRKSVHPRVDGLIAVVAEPHEMLGRNEERSPIIVRRYSGRRAEARALHLEAVLPGIVRRGFILRERIGECAVALALRDTVDVDEPLAHVDRVAGDGDDALDDDWGGIIGNEVAARVRDAALRRRFV